MRKKCQETGKRKEKLLLRQWTLMVFKTPVKKKRKNSLIISDPSMGARDGGA